MFCVFFSSSSSSFKSDLFFLLKNSPHMVYYLKIYMSIIFSVFTVLCNHHLKRTFLSLWKEMPYLPAPPYPHPLATVILLCALVDLWILNISYKWNHIIWSHLWFLSHHMLFKFYPHCSMNQYILWLDFIYPSGDGYFNCFHFVWIFTFRCFYGKYVFNSFAYTSSSRIAGYMETIRVTNYFPFLPYTGVPFFHIFIYTCYYPCF
jgi:hypothetical protein